MRLGRSVARPPDDVVGHHVLERNVALARDAIAQLHEFVEDAEFAPVHSHRAGNSQVRALLVVTVARDFTQLDALLERPLVPPHMLQPFAQRVVHRQQMRDVVDEIFELLRRERTRRPVAHRLRFRQTDVLHVAHQIRERNLHAVTEKRRRDLRVEDVRRHHLEAIGENLEIRREGVSDDRFFDEAGDQRTQIGDRQADRR